MSSSSMNKQPREHKGSTPTPTPPPRRAGSFPSPSSSSSSSDFEFTVSLSPSSRRSSTNLCPADELFYKGQLLPLHLSPRISMVRTLLAASSTSSSSSTDTTTTASRDSNSSSSSSSSSGVPSDLLLLLPECDSSRPSSVTEEDARFKIATSTATTKRNKYFSSFANRFSSVFLNRGGSKKDLASSGIDHLDYHIPTPPPPPPPAKRANSTARQVISKYVKKVKPLYERFSPKNQNQHINHHQNSQQKKKTFSFSIRRQRDITLSTTCTGTADTIKKLHEDVDGIYPSTTSHHSHSFSGNLRFPRRKRCAGSCPSSMRSSPTHSGLLRIAGGDNGPPTPPALVSSSSSSMEELQSAIQGAIAHCKNTMIQSQLKKSSNVISVN